MIARVLLALDRQNTRQRLRKLLAKPDVLVESPSSRANLWERIGRETCDLVVVSRTLVPEPVDANVAKYKSMIDAPALVVLSEEEDAEDRTRLLAAGCDAVLFSGVSPAEIVDALQTLLGKQLELTRESLAVKRVPREPRLEDFVSHSPIMKDFMDLVQRVVPSKASLLILGETGVGKERLARAIHRASGRAGAFVAVNCGALPESLLESELFGHEEGAFTGATRARRGCFELAHRGTIFLDEIGEMPNHLQVRLLRVLQEGEVQRVGGEWPIRIDVRVMAATARDLDEMARQGHFRKDLLYRLSVVTLKLPPLRERKEDVAELVDSYIDYFATEVGRNVTGIRSDALEALRRHDWPGNVRELINTIERATLLCAGETIDLVDLPDSVRLGIGASIQASTLTSEGVQEVAFPESWLDQPMRDARDKLIDHFEKTYLTSLLRATAGRIDETATRAGITTRALFDKMKRYGLRKESFKKSRP